MRSRAATGADGRPVSVAILDHNGHVVASYTTTASEGNWSVGVTGEQAIALADGSYTVTADVTDQFGNPATEATQTLTVHETSPTISIAAIAGDNVVNASEAHAGFAITGSETGADGRPVTVAILDHNGHVVASYTTTASEGSWSVNVTGQQATALADGSYTVKADVTDQFGNPATEATQTLAVHETLPTISIAAIAGDNVVNENEASAGFAIAGSETGADGRPSRSRSSTATVMSSRATPRPPARAAGRWA